MATLVAPEPSSSLLAKKLKKGPGISGGVLFSFLILAGIGYCGFNIVRDIGPVSLPGPWPYFLLTLALLIALGFEFVNGFHDTANAVAAVIYTHSLDPLTAVVWSGIWNLIGVLASSGAVAYAVVSLLPAELILQVSSGAGFAMVFALLLAAIMWNLATWWLGLPASSSHTMIGSILGVGLANQLMSAHRGTAGVDWNQAGKVFEVLLISPIVGFGCAALLMLLAKRLIQYPELFEAPRDEEPPPFLIRLLLIGACTGVSYGHGSNDGQKGMGLIMLILIGTVPTAYALNHTQGTQELVTFVAVSDQAARVVDAHVAAPVAVADPRAAVTNFLNTKELAPDTLPALRDLILQVSAEVSPYKQLKSVPAGNQQHVRNDMYVASAALTILEKSEKPVFNSDEDLVLTNYNQRLDHATKFIPVWVKVAVALALGLGTMVGWKRIVITVGEKIGKEHLNYAQGATAGIIAMGTIIAANQFGMPVSTTHVLSSGIAGTMTANGSGLQWSTIRSIAMGWVCTLPAAALLSGSLYCLFRFLA